MTHPAEVNVENQPHDIVNSPFMKLTSFAQVTIAGYSFCSGKLKDSQ